MANVDIVLSEDMTGIKIQPVREREVNIDKNLFKDVSFYREGDIIYGTYKDSKDSLKFGARLFKYIKGNRIREVYLNLDSNLNVEEVLIGIYLSSYEFDKYKKDKDDTKYKIKIKRDYENTLKKVNMIKDAVYLARDLANERPNTLNPDSFVDIVKDIFKNLPVNIIILDSKELREKGLEGIYAVGKGSIHTPKLLIIEYLPNKNENPIVLVGKGVCFDAGGIHLKPTGAIEDMYADMHGAASVIAALYGYIKLVDSGFSDPKNIVVLTPLVENLPSDRSIKPSDIIKHYNGLTTEIVNTDAEGRLILADSLSYACKQYKPKLIIDLATLTGGQIIALGYRVAAIMGNNKELIDNLINAGEKVNEYLWELPLRKYKELYEELIKGDVSDLKNVPAPTSREASSLVGGVFLQQFVDNNTPWAHIDIAGPAINPEEWEWMNKGGTGYGTRLLIEFLSNF